VFAPGLAVRQLATGQRAFLPPALLHSSEQRGSWVACRLSAHGVCAQHDWRLATPARSWRVGLERWSWLGRSPLASPRLALDLIWVGVIR
jgi:hypothetical protein